MTQPIAERMSELDARRVPFVHATVVRAERPTSARPGDDALVLADGTLEGFVGGQCARESVRTAALGAIDSGESVLLRVLPGGQASFPEAPGATVAVNPCLSGGAVEIYLQPHLPTAVVSIVGATPIADAVVAMAELLGLRAVRAEPGQIPEGTTATVICSLGDSDEQAVRAALDAGVGLIAMVASRRRGAAVLDALGLTDAERARVHTPAGIDIGARTPAEIAMSILAQVVRAIRLEGLSASGEVPPAEPVQVLDPVCGMTVVVMPDTPHLQIDGADVWFCGPHCRDVYAAQHAAG
jgi:xanthine dehydrogenase accessory factor